MAHTFISETDIKKIARKFWYLVNCAGCEFDRDCDGTEEDCLSFWSLWIKKFNDTEQ